MGETVVNQLPAGGAPLDPTGFFLDGEAPRLGAAPTIAAPPPEGIEPIAPAPPAIASLPAVPPITNTEADHAADLGDDQHPTTDAEPEHPMAHLMPSRTIPNEASRRAAEIRAAQKAKSKKIKIGLIAGMLVFTAVVGPPLGRWMIDAVNEAGSTGTVEQPAD